MSQDGQSDRNLIELLLNLNLVTRDQITEALEYQCRLPFSESKDLSELLIEMEYLSASALAQARQMFQQPVESSRTFQKRLDAVLEATEEVTQELEAKAASLIQPGIQPEVQSALQQPAAGSMLPAELPAGPAAQPPAALAKPIVPPGSGMQAAGAFSRRSPQPQMGQGWTIATPQTTPAPAAKAELPVVNQEPLGKILLKHQELEEWQLAHALCVQRDATHRPRLGTLLVKLGYADKQAVAKALSIQIQARS